MKYDIDDLLKSHRLHPNDETLLSKNRPALYHSY